MHDIHIGAFDMSPLQSSFDRLPEDTYTEGAFRFRRLSAIEPAGEGFRHKPGTIMQTADVNKFLGDVVREYEDIEDELFSNPVFIEMIRTFQKATQWFGEFQLHQIRIKAFPGKESMPAPEGPHRDGYTWTVPFVLGCTNVTGGEFTIFDDDMNPIAWLDATHNFARFPDKEVYHYADPIKLIDETKPGYWDTFVFTAG